MLVASDFSFLLSGGPSNRDPASSLGGDPSSRPLMGTLNNFFGDLPIETVPSGGYTDWRCFYIRNGNPTDSLFGASLAIVSQIEDGATVDLGFLTQPDHQIIDLSQTPVDGRVVFTYKTLGLNVLWGGSIAAMAENLVDAFAAVLGPGTVQASATTLTRIEVIAGGRFLPALVVAENTLGVQVAVTKVQDGSPVGSTTVEVDSATTPPSGIVYGTYSVDDPFLIGNLTPLDSLPVWVRRTIAADDPPVRLDGFTLRLGGAPASVGVQPVPPPLGPIFS